LLVSVIIPCFNVESYIEGCLFSVYSQSYKQFEVICIDNNSKDNTLSKIIALKTELYPDLIVLQEFKSGACAARNKGLSIAKGEWVQFLDADDILKPLKLEHQIELLKSKKAISFVAGAAEYVSIKEEVKVIIPQNIDSFVAVFSCELGNTCSNLWNRDVLNSVKGWNEDLSSSQETDLMFRILVLGIGVIVDNKPLTMIYERTSGQISQSNPINRWSNFIEVRLKMLAEIKLSHPKIFTTYQSDFETFLLSSIVILSKYDRIKALGFLNKYHFNYKTILLKYGIGKSILFCFKVFGPKTTFMVFSKR
jgi:glycosyltransferase involved in cell wall biosynthesis